MAAHHWRRTERPAQGMPSLPPVHVVRIGMARWKPDGRVAIRNRTHIQFALVTRGSAWFVQNGRRHKVPCGSLIVQQVGADCSHGTGPEGVLHKRWIELAGPGLTAWLQSLSIVERDAIVPADPSAVTACLRHIQALATDKPEAYQHMICLAACRLLLDQGNRLPRELERLYECIDRQEALSVAELTEYCDCHPRRLQRLCREHLGRSPQDLLRQSRLDRACQLLADSDLSIASISDRLGFADQFGFSHHIRRHLGCSPSTWSETHREETDGI